jgi:general secretion pathway protein C
MQELVKRHFWVVIALAVAGSAVFAAKLGNHVLAGTLLADAKHGPRVTRQQAAPTLGNAARSKDGQPIIDRNMFCSDCLPPVVDPVAVAAGPIDPSIIPLTALPLQLIATHVSEGRRAEKDSHAFILNTANQRQGAYWVGHMIPDAGPVVAVHHRYVDFENQGTKRKERISITGEAPPPPPPPAAAVAEPAVAATGDGSMDDAINAGVRKIDDSTYEIDRSLVDKVLANPMAIAKGARVMPSSKNGEPDGFRLYAVRPSSVYSKLGFANGDTIHAINGFELNSMDKAMEVYGKLRDAGSLQVNITRRGKPVTINYTIR